MVLIESDWNLKECHDSVFGCDDRVLIESDWNLKFMFPPSLRIRSSVLIESDWNLKDYTPVSISFFGRSINRIRLEFKGVYLATGFPSWDVLIESDWNLKFVL